MFNRKRWKDYKGNKKDKDAARAWYKATKNEFNCMSGCGEDNPAVLEFHHRQKETKEATISSMVKSGVPLFDIRKEAAKCDILCKNCHAKVHFNERVIEKDPSKIRNWSGGRIFTKGLGLD
jgi:hypothetical protein